MSQEGSAGLDTPAGDRRARLTSKSEMSGAEKKASGDNEMMTLDGTRPNNKNMSK